MLVVLSSVTTQYFIAYNGFITPIDYWLQRAERVKICIRSVERIKQLLNRSGCLYHCIKYGVYEQNNLRDYKRKSLDSSELFI